MMEINYVSSPTASGKTHALPMVIKPQSRNIIATPRKKLSREIGEAFSQAFFKTKVITGKDIGTTEDGIQTYSDCGKALRDTVNADNHECIVVDHSVAMRRIPGVEQYDLFIDEVPTVVKNITIKGELLVTQQVFMSLFQDEIISESHLFYEIKSTDALVNFITGKDADEALPVSAKFRELRHAIMSDDHQVVIRGASLQRYRDLFNTDPEKVSQMRLTFRIITMPSVLRNYCGFHKVPDKDFSKSRTPNSESSGQQIQ